MGQSIVLGKVKAEAPLQNENPMKDQIIWQQYIQQIKSLSPENKVSKFCKEAGFMRVVEVGQYFVTCKGNEPCTSYSRTFTIHNYGYGIAYTFTHNNITLEHTAMNDKNTIAHTGAYITQF